MVIIRLPGERRRGWHEGVIMGKSSIRKKKKSGKTWAPHNFTVCWVGALHFVDIGWDGMGK